MRSPVPGLLAHIRCLIKLYCAPCNKIPSLFQEAKYIISPFTIYIDFSTSAGCLLARVTGTSAQGDSGILHCVQAGESTKGVLVFTADLPPGCCSHCRQKAAYRFPNAFCLCCRGQHRGCTHPFSALQGLHFLKNKDYSTGGMNQAGRKRSGTEAVFSENAVQCSVNLARRAGMTDWVILG